MMTEHMEEHMRAWGVPTAYRQDYAYRPDDCWALGERGGQAATAVRHVAVAANWYAEQTAAVVAMVLDGDGAALRGWDRAALVVIGRETADDPDDDGEQYADDVVAALDALADIVEEEG